MAVALAVSKRSGLDLSPETAPCVLRDLLAAAQHPVSPGESQVVDFIDGCKLLRKRAASRETNRIKGLAVVWAGSSQSYPHARWTEAKVLGNHELGAPLADELEEASLKVSSRAHG